MQAYRTFNVSSHLRFAVLGKARPGQAAVLQDEGGMPSLVHLARTVPDAEAWLKAHPSYRARVVPADASIPRTYTYLQDADHGWLIVSRADLDSAGLSPADFSTWSYVCGDTLALDQCGDMPKFLKRLDERGIPYRLHDRRTEGDAPVSALGLQRRACGPGKLTRLTRPFCNKAGRPPVRPGHASARAGTPHWHPASSGRPSTWRLLHGRQSTVSKVFKD